MRILLPMAAAGLVLSTAAVHPQPYDRGPALIEITPPSVAIGAPPPPRMVCIIDTPFPYHQQRCETRPGYPGSPCRCEGSLFEGGDAASCRRTGAPESRSGALDIGRPDPVRPLS